MPAATLAPTKPASQMGFSSLRRFTVEEYHRVLKAGILTAADRCELIRGLIVRRPNINPPHATSLRKMYRQFAQILHADVVLGSQVPITLADSEPFPDFFLATGTENDYISNHPGPSELELVIEISDTSLPEDKHEKLVLYAENKIREYWIVNIPERRIEVYTQPRGGKNPTYRTRVDYSDKESVPVNVSGKKVGEIAVKEVLP